MYRFIEEQLVQWQTQSNRKPLILRGLRQVGKTYSVLDFGKKYFSGKVHLIDFEKRPDLHPIFETNLDVQRIVSELELVLNIRIEPGSDLLFFDEIQNCPRALSALRYFYEDMPELHVIAAGSLLDFSLKIISFPVGRVQFMEMYPLSFEEFLLAMGKDIAVDFLKSDNENISPTFHSSLLDDVRKYFFVGGMPECVKIFAEKGKYQPVFDIQTHLIETFREDFSKYSPHADKRCLNSVLVNSARSVGKQIIYSHLTEGFSNPTIKNAFDLLTKARLLYRIPSASPAGIPLAASASKKKFKALFADIGLMQNLCGIRTGEELFKSDLLAIYNGALAEQFVGQELLAHSHNPLYYWAREAKSSTAEVDYLFEKNGKILPIEVKSGSGGRLKSLHLLLKTFSHIDSGYVCSSASFATLPEQKLKFIPLYAVNRLV